MAGSRARSSRARAPAKRRRRSAEDAHEEILDAADKRLAAGGPRGIRLQEIAADVGVSHPTILHHFGSREGLVEAVVDRALTSLRRDIVAAFSEQPIGPRESADLVRRIAATLGDRGHARLMAWLALEGRPEKDPARMLEIIGRVMHTRRRAELGSEAPFEDTLFVVLLLALALFGEGVLGDAMFDSAGLVADAQTRERFHAWLVRLVEGYLHVPEPT